MVRSCDSLNPHGNPQLIHFEASGHSFINPELGKSDIATVRACSYNERETKDRGFRGFADQTTGNWAPDQLEIQAIDCQMTVNAAGRLVFSGTPQPVSKTITVPPAIKNKPDRGTLYWKFKYRKLQEFGCNDAAAYESCPVGRD
ncbi:MAG: hypothetical protein V1798_11045 [Pseudomonadota bacterium]